MKKYFSKDDLKAIASEIAASEQKHRAEIRVAIEANLEFPQLIRNISARRRALQTFSQLGIWDTEENNGVLLYFLLADHRVEIIADRGIDKILGYNYWEKINKEIIVNFQNKNYVKGILHAVSKITAEMIKLFPKQEGGDPNELPDEVIIL